MATAVIGLVIDEMRKIGVVPHRWAAVESGHAHGLDVRLAAPADHGDEPGHGPPVGDSSVRPDAPRSGCA